MPFRKQLGNAITDCWTSNDWRLCYAFGALYPDLDYKGEDALKRLNYLYEWSVPLSLEEDFGRPPPEMVPLDLSRSEFFARSTIEKDDSTASIVDHVA